MPATSPIIAARRVWGRAGLELVQGAELTIGGVDKVPATALTEHIAKRRRDRAFQARLKASIKRNQEILDRLSST